MKLVVQKKEQDSAKNFWPIINKLGNLSEIEFSNQPAEGAVSFIVKSTEFFIPLNGKIDAEKDFEAQAKELEYQQGFLASVNKKLQNERFVSSAPAQVIEAERKKKEDAEARINILTESLKNYQK